MCDLKKDHRFVASFAQKHQTLVLRKKQVKANPHVQLN